MDSEASHLPTSPGQLDACLPCCRCPPDAYLSTTLRTLLNQLLLGAVQSSPFDGELLEILTIYLGKDYFLPRRMRSIARIRIFSSHVEASGNASSRVQ